jgi:hypothetical protein
MVITFSDGTEIKLQQGTSIQSLILFKDRFNTREEAINWVKENNFKVDKIDEPKAGNTFRFRQIEPEEFKDDGFGPDEKYKTIDITNGVKAAIGFLKENQMQEDKENKDNGHKTSFENRGEKEMQDNQIEFSTNISAIKFSETDKNTVWIEIMRTIFDHDHGPYGKQTITKEDLIEYKENFDNQIRGSELPINYFHKDESGAAGWIKDLDIRENGDVLFGKVEFTEKGAKKIREKEVRFFSPEIFHRFKAKTGEVIKNVMVGGALTNKPFLDLSPIKLSENLQCCLVKSKEKEIKMTELKELTEQNVKLSEQNSDLTVKFSEVSSKLTEVKSENENLINKLAEIEKESELVKFEAAFNTLLDSGKVVPAMKDKLKEKFNSEDLVKFYADFPPVIKMGESVGHSVVDDSKSLTDTESKVAKEMGYSKEDILTHGRK